MGSGLGVPRAGRRLCARGGPGRGVRVPHRGHHVCMAWLPAGHVIAGVGARGARLLFPGAALAAGGGRGAPRRGARGSPGLGGIPRTLFPWVLAGRCPAGLGCHPCRPGQRPSLPPGVELQRKQPQNSPLKKKEIPFLLFRRLWEGDGGPSSPQHPPCWLRCLRGDRDQWPVPVSPGTWPVAQPGGQKELADPHALKQAVPQHPASVGLGTPRKRGQRGGDLAGHGAFGLGSPCHTMHGGVSPGWGAMLGGRCSGGCRGAAPARAAHPDPSLPGPGHRCGAPAWSCLCWR